jgi:hypothetical protein
MCFKFFGLHFQYATSIVYTYIVLQAATSCLKIDKKIQRQVLELIKRILVLFSGGPVATRSVTS